MGAVRRLDRCLATVYRRRLPRVLSEYFLASDLTNFDNFISLRIQPILFSAKNRCQKRFLLSLTLSGSRRTRGSMDMRVGTLSSQAHAEAKGWFVVQHKPNAESVAVRNLERQDIAVFAPFEVVSQRTSGRQRDVRRPLFPGYIFIHFEAGGVRWRAVNSTLGVCRIVSFGSDQPAPVPPALMQGLFTRCDAAGQLLPPDRLCPGDQVQIATGPFAEFVATVERLVGQERVWLLLEMLGRPTRLMVERAQLLRAG